MIATTTGRPLCQTLWLTEVIPRFLPCVWETHVLTRWERRETARIAVRSSDLWKQTLMGAASEMYSPGLMYLDPVETSPILNGCWPKRSNNQRLPSGSQSRRSPKRPSQPNPKATQYTMRFGSPEVAPTISNVYFSHEPVQWLGSPMGSRSVPELCA